MGKNQEERKTPVIVVKKRRTFSPPSLSEKTDIIAPVFTEQTAESAPAGINSSAVETHIPEAPARKKKKKRHRFPRPSHWTREYTHECVEKIKALFPHLRAEGGGFIPLKIGISNDICKRTARAVLTGMCYSAGSAMRHGSSSLTRLTGQSAMTPSTWRR